MTILLSWTFIHVIFAFHYAHEFYDESGAALLFPGGEDPDYWDFAYFSFVIGTTAQVSDVEIASKSIRRVATAHSITSFLFNIALLSLMINVAASFVTSNCVASPRPATRRVALVRRRPRRRSGGRP